MQVMERDLALAMDDQYDVIAPQKIDKAAKHFKEAKKEYSDKGSLKSFWDDMGIARGYLNEARDLYEARSPKAHDVLQARAEVLRSGVRRHEETAKDLKKLDNRFRKLSGGLEDKDPRTEDWAKLGRDYRDLEVESIQANHLAETRKLIEDAKDHGAKSNAPRTLADAETSYRQAESAIAQDPHNASAFAPAVRSANRQARLLVAVNATARKTSGQSNEAVARSIIMRDQAINSLEGDLAASQAEADATAQALAGKDAEARGLAFSNRTLLSEQEWNDAIEEARGEFSEDEAEVYRQGDKLLIRLKKVQFPSGSAKIPEPSKAVLGKVSNVIEELNAKNVEVQGHTDSTGDAKINKKISTDRAKAVASLLVDGVKDVDVKAVGYGYEKPIVTNKTPQGRAINRRVDVVIIPAPASSSANE
jgi:outer membrane protein OmpA-like peptidoglycan-associated protein